MTPKKSIVVYSDGDEALPEIIKEVLPDGLEVIPAENSDLLKAGNLTVQGAFVSSKFLKSTRDTGRIVDILTTGIAKVDFQQRIIWSNSSFQLIVGQKDLVGTDFYLTLGDCQIEGPDFCPFHTVRSAQKTTMTRLRVANKALDLVVTPYRDSETGEMISSVAELRDVTETDRIDKILQQLLDAGRRMTDFSSEQLVSLTIQERRDLLGIRIEASMKQILHYDVAEFRLYEEATGKLLPFLSFGIAPDAAVRELYAEPDNNGITGYVAHNREPYWCEDTTDDPFYLQGAIDARCSLTIPILWHGQLFGTCNVESLQPGAFTLRDQTLLEIFLRDVANALHTFRLLSTAKEDGIARSIQSVLELIANPVDRILQDASVLLAETDCSEASQKLLRDILKKTRVLKDQVTLVRLKMRKEVGCPDAPADGLVPVSSPILQNRRVLILDKKRENLIAGHQILEPLGCEVETAPDTLIALKMIAVSRYDAIISEYNPDGGMDGYQFFLRLKAMFPELPAPPLLLGIGYERDSGHIMTNAQGQGLLGRFFIPYIPNQIRTVVELVINSCGRRDNEGNLISPEELDADFIPLRSCFPSRPSSLSEKFSVGTETDDLKGTSRTSESPSDFLTEAAVKNPSFETSDRKIHQGTPLPVTDSWVNRQFDSNRLTEWIERLSTLPYSPADSTAEKSPSEIVFPEVTFPDIDAT